MGVGGGWGGVGGRGGGGYGGGGRGGMLWYIITDINMARAMMIV